MSGRGLSVIQIAAALIAVALLSITHRVAYLDGVQDGFDSCNAVIESHMNPGQPTFNNSHIEGRR